VHKYWDSPAPARPPAAAGRLPEAVELRQGGRSLRLAPAAVLAPMSGITDTVFRRFIRDLGGCGLIMTEFTSADGLVRSEKVARRYLNFAECERPIAAQLFGSDPDVLAEAAAVVERMGFDSIDLNLGCPAKKVVKCNGGSGLLRDLPLLERLFLRLRRAVSLPFTVKFRAGWDEAHLVHVELARLAEACGVNGLALHARTREQGYSGQAQWRWIAEVKQAVSIPVFGNGDIRSPEDAAAMAAQTGCDGVMIGRAAASNPWIFRQMESYRRTGAYAHPGPADRGHLIADYFERLVREGMPGSLGKMKQFAAWFTHGVEDGGRLRKAVYEARSEAEALDRVHAFFAEALVLPAAATL
jgi:tRNA-dihydrouridine synthase B